MADDRATQFECPEPRALATRRFQSRPGDRAAWFGPRRPDVLTLGLSGPAPASGPAPLQGLGLSCGPHRPWRRGHGGEETSLLLRPSPATAPSPRPLVLAPRAPAGLLLSRPLPPTGSVRPWPVPPLACAAASLGAAGGGNSLALTLDWLSRALGWGRPDAPEAEERTTAVCVPTSRVSAWPGTYLQTSRTVCPGTEGGQGRGDKRDQGQRGGATLPSASGGGG